MLVEVLKNYAGSQSPENIAEHLHLFAVCAVEKAKNHAKRILTQLPEFDLHDEIHLSVVLKNMEQIIGEERIAKLSVYELFFLYVAAHLHDIGMALPDWELNVIQAVESGKNDSWESDFNAQAPLSISIAQKLVKQNAAQIYDNFERVKEWYFAPSSEDSLVEYLAQTIVDYQEFRSGFTKKLTSFFGKEKTQYIRSLRIEFIRQNHHVRSQNYIKNLNNQMPDEIQPWGEAITRDLALICRSHGEPIEFVEELKTSAQYIGSETANLQFVASLLRLADIVHYSFDRAPLVLATEMQFKSDESFIHWAVKQQGVNYNVAESTETGEKRIQFRAYCKSPRYYYELHTYLDWVDCELNNYARLSRRWELTFGKSASENWEKWCIPLSDVVDRSGIEYDSDSFTPVSNLTFKLEQKRILELLMGVQLYKDKYACLRELYQNSLDACRCMIALSSTKENGNIEFWIESGDDKNTYLCCFDNGVGMTKDIVLNHLLNIGNSFYTSPTFERLQAANNGGFTPTSQFGIGILSCFMLGDRLDIVTRPMQEFSEETVAIRFTVDGVHENFYYSAPDPVDLEKIGKHGTIVRIRLFDRNLIQDVNDGKMWFRYFVSRMSHDFENESKSLFKNWDSHLHNIVTKFVSLPRQDISVIIRLADGSTEKVLRWDYPFEKDDFDIDDTDINMLEEHLKKYHFSENFLEKQYQMKLYPCKEECNGIEFSWLLKLPMPSDENLSNDLLSDIKTFFNPGVSIDGLSVAHKNLGLDRRDLDWLANQGHLNFTGEVRPVLSVDRTSITSWPDTIKNSLDQLLSRVISETIDVVHQHIESEKLNDNHEIIFASWDLLLKLFSPFTSEILSTLLSEKIYTDAYLKDIEALTQGVVKTLKDFINLNSLVLSSLNFQNLSLTAQLLFLGKALNANQINVDKSGLCLNGQGVTQIEIEKHDTEREFSTFLLKSDQWSGPFAEYDLVSQYWPIVPASTFDKIFSHGEIEKNDPNGRYCRIHRFSNGLTALGEQDPCLVHPLFGLYQKSESFHLNGRKNDACMVGKFDRKEGKHWLFEINGHDVKSGETRYILFVHIAPRELTDEEIIVLKEYEVRDSAYAEGVKNGWSLLFLGQKHTQPIICPGIVSRQSIVDDIEEEIWKKLGNENHSFLDGTPLQKNK